MLIIHTHQQLLFIYNAQSGLVNGMLDMVHKLVSPGTYPCHLCAVTYGLTGMRTDWKQYVKKLEESYTVMFLHLDELYPDLPTTEYPCVLLARNSGYLELVTAEEMKGCATATQLMALLDRKLAETDKS
ncbi:hypothetical protein ACFO9Q_20545 [Paenibacillus sp. GCM10023252]|uniref:hypothetical protein n=1 Tax=Paenibacillus sp. GCM10023252 TaxID=3252649 RepID=UPI003618E3F2